jgi:molybdate transport system regulatory protein
MPSDPHAPVSIKIRIFHEGIPAFGPGKAALLEAILQCQSISAAGRSMGLSYTKTRRLVSELNHSFRFPLVESSKGGAQFGGAQVTEAGRKLLAVFRAMEAQAEEAIQDRLQEIMGALNQDPGAVRGEDA